MTRPYLPFAAACAGVAIYSAMDTLMKRLSIDSGAYAAVLWRSWAAVALMVPPVAWARRWPDATALRLHLARGGTAGLSVLLFFWGMARVPMAQSVALTFLAPLIAILLAAAMLGERLRAAALGGAGVAAVGVLAIGLGQAADTSAGATSGDTLAGTAAIVLASLIYAVSLVLLRRQAQVARPLDVAFFSSLVIAVAMLPASPWAASWPDRTQLPAILGAAVLGTVSALLIAWAYARAEAQMLAPTEYSAFLWAALFGRLAFGEGVSAATVAGAALIVAGCLVAVRRSGGTAPLTEAGA